MHVYTECPKKFRTFNGVLFFHVFMSLQLQDKQEKIKTLEKSLEDVKTKLQKEESKRKTAENNLAAEKISKGSTTDKPAVGKLKKVSCKLEMC